MIIQSFPSGPFETNAYVIACPVTLQAAIIDPAPKSADSILSFLEQKQLKPTHLILTHSHWDHIADTAQLKKKIAVSVNIHMLDVGNLQNPGSDGLKCWIPIEGIQADHFLEEGDEVKVGEISFKVIHTPGHTPGGICLYCEKESILLSGDTLFKGSIGNISFPTAQPEKMWESLAKLALLPPETRVYPGHGPSTTIEAESWLPRAREIFENN